jgi:hypothetical protein
MRKPERSARSRKGARQLRREAHREEAERELAKAASFLARDHRTIPDEWSLRYVRALVNMAEDAAVRRKAAWLIERKARLPAVSIIVECLHLAARNVAEHRVAMKPQEVAERRATLNELVASGRAEAEAAAALGRRVEALELQAAATEIETLAASLYREGDPALVAYRNCDEDAPEALARGTLLTLARSLTLLHASPLAGVAAAFASAAAGVKLTRDRARLKAGPETNRARRTLAPGERTEARAWRRS